MQNLSSGGIDRRLLFFVFFVVFFKLVQYFSDTEGLPYDFGNTLTG